MLAVSPISMGLRGIPVFPPGGNSLAPANAISYSITNVIHIRIVSNLPFPPSACPGQALKV
jgi:hypothetical protein